MPIFELTTPLAASPQEVYDWHARPGAFLRLAPPWERIGLDSGHPRLEDGSRVVLRMKKGPLAVRWVAEHRAVRPGRGFEDVQVRGPFARWVHRHDFAPRAGGGTDLRDRVDYRLPGGALGAALGGRRVRSDLERTFAYRHATTAADLALHQHQRHHPRLTVAVTGAGGLIGSVLGALLASGGHRVVPLPRDPSRGVPGWDPANGLLEPSSFPAVDALVHLAGENIAAGRWSAERMRRIRDSRVEGTTRLVESLARLEHPPSVLVAASAVGIYGDRGSQPVDEESAAGEGFLAEVGRRWEAAALAAERLGIRVVVLRFGVVLTPAGGFLARLLPPFRLGLGGPVGSGDQMVSWISIDDAAGAVLHCLLEEDLRGPINAVAPGALSNRALTRALGRVLRRPTVAPLPAFMARALFGRMADELLLSGADVRPTRLLASGYPFRHPDFSTAARHLLGRTGTVAG